LRSGGRAKAFAETEPGQRCPGFFIALCEVAGVGNLYADAVLFFQQCQEAQMEGSAWIAVAIGFVLAGIAIAYVIMHSRQKTRAEHLQQKAATKEIYQRQGE
jgi:formamidopyrimidine-DNA glycosylase